MPGRGIIRCDPRNGMQKRALGVNCEVAPLGYINHTPLVSQCFFNQRNRLNTMKAKNKGKQAKGYVPGDFKGNFWRATWGTASVDQVVHGKKQIPYKRDDLRLGILMWCCDAGKTKQVNFFTCSELMVMFGELLNLPTPANNAENKTELVASAQRHLRKVCHGLGIKLKPSTVGRQPENTRTF